MQHSRTLAVAAWLILSSCGGTVDQTRSLEDYAVAADGITISGTVFVTACEDVQGLAIEEDGDTVAIAAKVQLNSGDCDTIAEPVKVSGQLSEPIGSRTLTSRVLSPDG